MAQASTPGSLGVGGVTPNTQDGTTALTPSPGPGSAGLGGGVPAATDAVLATDAAIEALGLAQVAKTAAYALKKEYPTVSFTSGKRTKEDQARAMSGNVVLNRKWIEETYAKSGVRDACQKWLDDNPEKKTREEIEAGLIEVLNKYTDAQLGVFSKHISGMAFDVQPVEQDAEEIKKTIRDLVAGKGKFLEKEGGLVRWHAQFD